MNRNNRILNFFASVMLFFCLALPVQAKEFNFDVFKQLPVVHEGRVKPLGRVAQLTLQKISGVKAPINNATEWLANVLFDPAGAESKMIFFVPDKNLQHALGLEKREQTYYSFQELNKAFTNKADLILSLRQDNPKDLTKEQSSLLDLYAQATYFEQLKGSMTLVLLLKTSEKIPQRFIDHPKNKEIAALLLTQGKNNQSFLVVPVVQKESLTWQTPWQYFLSSENHVLVKQWANLADSYLLQDADQWQGYSDALYHETLIQTKDASLDFRLKTELFYLSVDPYFISLILYASALLFLIFNRSTIASIMVAGGLGFHLLGLTCRMIILQRPPVSDLYESLLFVGAIIVGATLIYFWRKKEKLVLLAGAVLGVILHSAGFALSGDYDTLKVLQAVLDTKFWLATHVLIITAGYALCLLTSAIAHYCLYRFPASRKATSRLYLMALISLLFVGTGTLLGGVWADQSWGRFWGWDPKENGALLIALWIIWLLHGKVTRHITPFYFTMGLAALSLIVALSWIGINLLGIGLHSYGFMQGSVSSLSALFIIEIGFFILCWKRSIKGK